jgi:hypothetical protein
VSDYDATGFDEGRNLRDSLRLAIESLALWLINKKWAIILAWAIWLTAESLFLGPFSYIRMHDVGDSILPMRLALNEAFFNNGIFYWFPYAACGADRLSLTALNFAQVDNLFFLFLPGWLAYGLATFLQRLIAGYFTYRLCKDCLKLDILPSIIAGLVYSISFSSLLYGEAYHSILQTQFAGEMGLPFILWSIEYIYIYFYKEKNIYSYLLTLLLGIFVVFSSNFALSVPFILPIILIWFALIRKLFTKKFILMYIIFSSTILLGNIPMIWALLINSTLSHRAHWPLFTTLGGFEEALNGAILKSIHFIKTNSFYLLLGIMGLILSKPKDRRLFVVLLLTLFCGSVAYLINPFWAYYAKPLIGPISGFQIDRFYQEAPFFAALCVGFGMHYLSRNRAKARDGVSESKKSLMPIAPSIVVLLFLVIISGGTKIENAQEWCNGACYAIQYENFDLLQLSRIGDHDPHRVATVAYGLNPASSNAYGLESADGYVVLYPFSYQEFWGKVIEPLTLNDSYIYNYFHNWGNRIYLFAPSNGSFDQINQINFSDYYNLNLLSLANVRYIICSKPLINDNLTLLPSHIPEHAHIFSQGMIAERLADNLLSKRLYIYKNNKCLPRFFVVQETRIFNDSTQLLDSLSSSDVKTLRNVAFLERKTFIGSSIDEFSFADGNITIVKYSPDMISLHVRLRGSGILVTTNNYSPYWRCLVEGAERSIFPVDGTFCGVCLQGGEMNVTLEYQPPYRS